MNTTQIKYFLEAAKTLNFTEAAKKLYITQSALSQQISSLEGELSMVLFFRNRNKLKLTPAGVVLLNELDSFMEYYDRILERAAAVNQGYEGHLSIGVLQGHELGSHFVDTLQSFKDKHPRISFEFHSGSLRKLREDLEHRRVDLIYTMGWDISREDTLLHEEFQKDQSVFVVGKYHPLAGKKIADITELEEYTFILPADDESQPGYRVFIDGCKRKGFTPLVKTATSIEEVNLLVEAGEGIGMVSTSSYIHGHSNYIEIGDAVLDSFVFAWDKSNTNPVIALFTEYMCTADKE